MIAGYFGGITDSIVMRLIDFVLDVANDDVYYRISYDYSEIYSMDFYSCDDLILLDR